MSSLRQLLPVPREIALEELPGYAAELAAPSGLEAFDPAVLDFCARLGRALRRATDAPELVALGFWLRPAALARLRDDVLAADRPVRLVPRGTVFAIPPANVDTVFAYTWLLALLLGNRTVIRVPGRSGRLLERLLEGVRVAMAGGSDAAASRVARASVVVSYGHDDEVTSALSAACDLRILWGGDETVTTLRRLPLPATARELAFGDRSALCVLDASGVADLGDAGLADLARAFVADAYPFDQRACSSPRAVVWRTGGRPAAEIRSRFWSAVRADLDRRDAPALGAGIDALTTAWDRAADRPDLHIESTGLDLTVVSGVDLGGDRDGWRTRHPGGGLFAEVEVADLADLAALVVRRDQTLTVFGFHGEEAAELAARCGRRGVDRVVPVGAALQFARWWDGVDLVAELTRLVHVASPAAPPARSAAGAPAERAETRR